MSGAGMSNDVGALDRIVSLFVGLLIAVRSSFLVFTITLGVLMFVTGMVLLEGVLAGLFGIFGVSAVLYGVLGYVGLKLIGYT